MNGYMFGTPNDQSPSRITEEQVIMKFAQPINMQYNTTQNLDDIIVFHLSNHLFRNGVF